MPDQISKQAIFDAFSDAIEEGGFSPEGFTILGEIQRGGMAMVYLAEQRQPKREVALKMILPRFVEEKELRDRFEKEAYAMAKLDHPGILPIYQVGEWDGLSFIAMKLASGGSLEDRLMQEDIAPSDLVDLLIKVGEAVHFAHLNGVLHRDIKPGNLLFDHRGEIYVSDFGVAKLEHQRGGKATQANQIIGTPNYLAPEVATGETSSGSVATDLYGIGAVMYRGLTGKVPFEGGDNLAAQLRKIVESDLIPVRKLNGSVDSDLSLICEKALAKDPSARYRSVIEFVEDLKRWKSGHPILARPVSSFEELILWVKRSSLVAGLLGLLFLTLIAGLVVFTLSYRERGELLRESLLEQAKAERLVMKPGFRGRGIELLKAASEFRVEEELRTEAVASMFHWDTGSGGKAVDWVTPKEGMLEVVEGAILYNPPKGNQVEISLNGVLRCPPVINDDGGFVAFMGGDTLELVIYDTEREMVSSVVSLRGWADELKFVKGRNIIKVSFDDGTASLIDIDGRVLLSNFDQASEVMKPVGIRRWDGGDSLNTIVLPYGGKLSPNKKVVATTSANGIQFWGVKEQVSTGFYEVQNQRVDAPTDVWWLDNYTLIVQIPGALERISIDDNAKVLGKKGLARTPGSRVRDILPNGNWVMEIRDEEGRVQDALWINGDSEQQRPLSEVHKEQIFTINGNEVSYRNWQFTIPYVDEVLQGFELEEGRKVLVLCENHSFYEIDLKEVSERLRGLEFETSRETE